MADNNTSQSNKKKEYKPTKVKNKKATIDKANIIFFVLMIVGLVFFTIILLLKSNSKIYETKFGDDIISTVTLSDSNKIDISVEIDDVTSIQHGTYKEITDDKVDNNYMITINADDEDVSKQETLEMIVEDTTVKLKYEDGSIIEYKERENE